MKWAFACAAPVRRTHSMRWRRQVDS